MRRFLKFGAVGTAVFVFDALCLHLLLMLVDSHVAARLVSVALALTASWLLNRSWTFRSASASAPMPPRALAAEYLQFCGSQLFGLGVNVVVSLWVLSLAGGWPAAAFVAVAAGSVSGMAVNFMMASRVFRARAAGG